MSFIFILPFFQIWFYQMRWFYAYRSFKHSKCMMTSQIRSHIEYLIQTYMLLCLFYGRNLYRISMRFNDDCGLILGHPVYDKIVIENQKKENSMEFKIFLLKSLSKRWLIIGIWIHRWLRQADPHPEGLYRDRLTVVLFDEYRYFAGEAKDRPTSISLGQQLLHDVIK